MLRIASITCTRKESGNDASNTDVLIERRQASIRERRYSAALLAVVLFPLFCGPTSAQEWKIIRPATTSEAELIKAFGPPDEVISTFPWAEWSAKWKKRPKAHRYTLRYSRYADKSEASELLLGPGGPADGADVEISGGRVMSVVWHYGGYSARVAAKTLRADSSVKVGGAEEVSRAFGRTEHGVLVVEIGFEDSRVDVRLELK